MLQKKTLGKPAKHLRNDGKRPFKETLRKGL
jgi:hypothetical protein